MAEIRDLRALFARDERHDHIYYSPSPNRREILLARREGRRWRRRLFRLGGFSRACDHMELDKLYQFVTHLPILGMLGDSNITALADSYDQARTDVQIAARVLRKYAVDQSESTRDLLLKIAADIERRPSASSNEISHAVFDFDLVGRRGGATDRRGAVRGFLVRDLNAWIPANVPKRFACISELAKFLGYWDTSSTLVRSILLKGKT